MDLAAELKKTVLFKELSSEDLRKLSEIATERSLAQQDTLFKEGESGDELFIIAMGSVELIKRRDNGEDQVVAILGSGSYFGEMSLVRNNHTRGATVRGLEKTFLLSFHSDKLDELADDDPEFGYAVYRALAAGLARRLSHARHDVAHFKALALALPRKKR